MTYTQFIDCTGSNFARSPLVAGGYRAGYNTGSGGVPWSSAQIAFARANNMQVLLYDQSPSLTYFATGHSHIADVEAFAGTIAAADAAIINRRKLGLTLHTVYCSVSPLAGVKASIADRTGVMFGVADYSWSLTQAEQFLAANPDWAYVQYGDPASNPNTLVPGTSVTLAQAQADINVAKDTWLAAIFGTPAPSPAPAPSPVPPASNWQEHMMQQLPVLATGALGNIVCTVQGLCCARHQLIPIDGIYGGRTKAAVEAVQAAAGITVDGVVGPKTWPALLGI